MSLLGTICSEQLAGWMQAPFCVPSKGNEEGTGILRKLCLVSGIKRIFLMRPTLFSGSRASKISVRGKFYQILDVYIG